ncbi:Helicase domain protein [Methanoculleus bourgensis]|uniref:Helicase domain protein n=1 Tax=Methanoculleus bourgensis TaxID=83986 RepID=A0A0X8XYW4_9EURY|nr:helicase-related protein [Methanoculleus bourgensis]CVK34538.1 Helicase domain protein [Methanoculleus bourgensis]
MSSDLTFITNEDGNTLLDRFDTLVKDTTLFDCLVGYFYSSGFYALEKALENTEKIRILIGISTNKMTYDLIQAASFEGHPALFLSSKDLRSQYSSMVKEELNQSEDAFEIEKGIRTFIEWLRSGKLEIRVYPSEKIHAKLYIMTFKEGDRDRGRVITGSSNFSQAGLQDNLEFNVELKMRGDYEYALKKFNELWENSTDVSESYVETIRTQTWLNDSITPYELYLKFLYEYLKEKINLDKQRTGDEYIPEGFMDLQYQKDAVQDAKLKLEEYGGVFISDVVGLGKTYIATLLAQQLDGRTLVLAPPVLIDRENPGSWPNVFLDFGVRQADFESVGKLDQVLARGTERYKNVIIDEAHRFRNEMTQSYENLYRICRGKRVVLVTATPLNNSPNDILSQIKLFQNAKKSTLPNPKVRNLQRYFNTLQKRLDGLDRQRDREEYMKIVKENAEDIRENVLQYLMVRRTRASIATYYSEDLKRQNLKFPEVEDPRPVYYHFDEHTDSVFLASIDLIVNKFKYSRYTPLLYLKEGVTQPEELAQRNMMKFMKILLLKRLESSFFAFRMSVGRFIGYYELFIREVRKGNVYISKMHMNTIFDLLEQDNLERITSLVEDKKVYRLPSSDFSQAYLEDLEYDLRILKELQSLWETVDDDPKIDAFIELLSTDPVLVDQKCIIFTEAKETADYLTGALQERFGDCVIKYHGSSSENERRAIIENFDAKARHPKDDYRILVTTEVLSEGVNLHRSNVVINYDIPWNPTRMMQRVGRINRVDTKFDTIHIFNFFPAGPINEMISLQEAAEAKIAAFIEMLGNDAPLLTDEEVKSHDLFTKLTSRETITGEDAEEDLELGYLTFLREIRDSDPDLFKKIKRLPKKARCGRASGGSGRSVVTFFRRGKLRKIFRSDAGGRGADTREVDFLQAADLLRADASTKKHAIEPDFYRLLESNKAAFEDVFAVERTIASSSGGKSGEVRLTRILRAIQHSPEFTDEDEEYVGKVLGLIEDGALPKATARKILKKIEYTPEPLLILAKLRSEVSEEFFRPAFGPVDISGPKEVILSAYFAGGDLS